MELKKDKKGLEWRELVLWLLLLAALALIIFGIMSMKEKGINILDKLKEILTFRK